jgi:flagellar basal-body rod protein FlgB
MSSNIFGVSEQAMQLCEDRAVMLTNNLTNASTPNYKAKDIDFHALLQQANANLSAGKLDVTQPGHLQMAEIPGNGHIKYRIPMQNSMDGNTVDPEIERKNFAENALRYQVSLTFITNKADEIHKAIKGE